MSPERLDSPAPALGFRGGMGASRPPSLLDARLFSREMMMGGAITAAVAHVGVPLLVIAITSFLASIVGQRKPEEYVEMHVVEARFVRLGKKPDPKKLP